MVCSLVSIYFDTPQLDIRKTKLNKVTETGLERTTT